MDKENILFHTCGDLREVNKNHIFIVEKRVSVVNGRTIFSTSHISIFIGYTVFLPSEENRIATLLTTWRPCLLFVNARKSHLALI